MRKIFIIISAIILLSSCMSAGKFITTPTGKEPSKYKERFVYSLPRTVLLVKMNFERTTYLPGPYRKFTEKYLNMSQYIDNQKTEWSLSGAEVMEYSEPDPLNSFSVNILRGNFPQDQFFDLSYNGLVLDPTNLISKSIQYPVHEKVIPDFIDLGLKKNLDEKVDTFFKTVITDSSFVKVPILRKQKTAKTLEQKAEETANLIIKIRKRRLKILTGEYNVFPDGQALSITVDELDKIEKENLALFVGKIYVEKFSQSFLIIPQGKSEEITFMKFSDEKGVLPEGSAEGVALKLKLKSDLEPVNIVNERNNINMLYYRIPSVCSAKILKDEELLYEGRISVFQAGEVLPLPASIR